MILRVSLLFDLMLTSYARLLQILHHTLMKTRQLQKEPKAQHLLNLHLTDLTHHIDLLEIYYVTDILKQILIIGRTIFMNMIKTQHVIVILTRRI